MKPEEKREINRELEARAAAIERARAITATADNDGKRELTAEERQEFDRHISEAEECGKRAKRLEALYADDDDRDRIKPDGGDDDPDARSADPRASAEYRAAFLDWARTGVEHRVISKASAGAGGNLVPREFEAELLTLLRNRSPIRSLARVITTDSGTTIDMPSVTSHGTAAWIAENGSFTPSDEVFGTFAIGAHKAGTMILVSEELLQDSAFDLEAYIREEFSERIGVLQDTAYLLGDGSAKPTGLLANVSTVAAGAAAAITFNDVLSLIHGVPSKYRRNRSELAFMVNDATVLALSLLQDANDQYIWQAALTAEQPDTIRGYPLIENPDMPTVAADARSVIFGNFRRAYLIRDVNGIAFQRLNELYAANGQVGFRAWHRTDGKVREADAARALLHPSS